MKDDYDIQMPRLEKRVKQVAESTGYILHAIESFGDYLIQGAAIELSPRGTADETMKWLDDFEKAKA